MITLTAEQEQAKGVAVSKLRDLRQHCSLGGYAGTGKTTLIAQVVTELERNFKKVAVMAPTGKAASVLTSKGVPATTIHRRLYELVEERPMTFALRNTVEADYFIIDESSMISVELYEDIKSFNKPCLFIGDPAQLEPVGNDAKLMHKPDFVLKEIHRTAQNSPIIQYATELRTTMIHPVTYSARMPSTLDPSASLRFLPQAALRRSDWLAFDQIIVGTNKTRHLYNQTFKLNKTGFYPLEGDKLICLKNDYQHGVFNGETFTVADSTFDECPDSGDLMIKLINTDGDRIEVPFWLEFFQDPSLENWKKPRNQVHLDFAYAITCHKSQGSEWNNVAVVDEAFGSPPNRWRYTAATRAAKQLTWIKK